MTFTTKRDLRNYLNEVSGANGYADPDGGWTHDEALDLLTANIWEDGVRESFDLDGANLWEEAAILVAMYREQNPAEVKP